MLLTPKDESPEWNSVKIIMKSSMRALVNVGGYSHAVSLVLIMFDNYYKLKCYYWLSKKVNFLFFPKIILDH